MRIPMVERLDLTRVNLQRLTQFGHTGRQHTYVMNIDLRWSYLRQAGGRRKPRYNACPDVRGVVKNARPCNVRSVAHARAR